MWLNYNLTHHKEDCERNNNNNDKKLPKRNETSGAKQKKYIQKTFM